MALTLETCSQPTLKRLQEVDILKLSIVCFWFKTGNSGLEIY